jgi:hypothetical protein
MKLPIAPPRSSPSASVISGLRQPHLNSIATMIPTTTIVTSAKTGAVPWKSPNRPPVLWMKSIRSQSPTIWLGLHGSAGLQGS